MTNNDILRRLRYTFDFSDSKMIAIFGSADLQVTREQISDWLKKEEDLAFQEIRYRLTPGDGHHFLSPVENIDDLINREVLNRNHMFHELPLTSPVYSAGTSARESAIASV